MIGWRRFRANSWTAFVRQTKIRGDDSTSHFRVPGVDAADYAVWRRRENTSRLLPNHPIGGTVDADQFSQWRMHFGEPLGGGTVAELSTGSSVPDPRTLWLLGVSAISTLKRVKRRV